MTVRAVFRRTVGAQWPILLVGSIFAVGFVLAGLTSGAVVRC
ncbi:integral membrane protein [Mycobacterium tuberculosis variant africanum]|nr:integral membrane protein [Mycobacterium tuberculosis variant africanum]AMC79221.1 integral membrane protein [Mycobacterium tuberculosis]